MPAVPVEWHLVDNQYLHLHSGLLWEVNTLLVVIKLRCKDCLFEIVSTRSLRMGLSSYFDVFRFSRENLCGRLVPKNNYSQRQAAPCSQKGFVYGR